MNKKKQILKYLLLDWLTALIAWLLFFTYRKYVVDPSVLQRPSEIFGDIQLYKGLVVVPLFWLVIYVFAGAYRNVYRKTRIREFTITFISCFIGVLILYFTLLIDDEAILYTTHYKSFIILFLIQFILTVTGRLVITTIMVKKIHRKEIGFNTLLVGDGQRAVELFLTLDRQYPSSGNLFLGFVSISGQENSVLKDYLPRVGNLQDLKNLIETLKIEEVIIALEPEQNHLLDEILSNIEDLEIIIKISPDMHDFMLGKVKTTSIFHEPLIQVSPTLLPPWQESLKRLIDITFSLVAIILLLPVFLILAIGVKLSSKGPVLYWQERIGLHGKPFMIPKFRSMYVGAENGLPQLSQKNDRRITPFGRIMRRLRLDEIPQFFSVLKGDMSLVGYRPERKYFIDQIMQRAPYYRMLFKIKPGITSWGMVKFGYASNVDEMIQRLKYDILYVENMSLAMDFKIMFYTILTIIQGRGK